MVAQRERERRRRLWDNRRDQVLTAGRAIISVVVVLGILAVVAFVVAYAVNPRAMKNAGFGPPKFMADRLPGVGGSSGGGGTTYWWLLGVGLGVLALLGLFLLFRYIRGPFTRAEIGKVLGYDFDGKSFVDRYGKALKEPEARELTRNIWKFRWALLRTRGRDRSTTVRYFRAYLAAMNIPELGKMNMSETLLEEVKGELSAYLKKAKPVKVGKSAPLTVRQFTVRQVLRWVMRGDQGRSKLMRPRNYVMSFSAPDVLVSRGPVEGHAKPEHFDALKVLRKKVVARGLLDRFPPLARLAANGGFIYENRASVDIERLRQFIKAILPDLEGSVKTRARFDDFLFNIVLDLGRDVDPIWLSEKYTASDISYETFGEAFPEEAPGVPRIMW